MYIESVPNRSSPPAILLRESFREQGRVRKRTLANLSAWPTALVEGFRTLLKGGVAVAADGIRIRRALPHGHATAVLGTIRAIGLDRLLGRPADKRLAPLAIALIASRLISPASKLATARDLAADTASSSLERLGLGAVDEVELYRALDWLGARQGAIETALARRHLKNGALVLYDVSSSWLEGRCCELARFGYSRKPAPSKAGGKKGKLQIVYGLLCAADGCPVAVEVFEGNTADPVTLSAQIDKLKARFGLSRVVLVGEGRLVPWDVSFLPACPRSHWEVLFPWDALVPAAGAIGARCLDFPKSVSISGGHRLPPPCDFLCARDRSPRVLVSGEPDDGFHVPSLRCVLANPSPALLEHGSCSHRTVLGECAQIRWRRIRG